MRSWRNRIAVLSAVSLLSVLLSAPLSSAAEGGGHGACRADIEKLCPNAKRGDGSIRECMRDHQDELSDACKQAIARRREHHWQKTHGQDTEAGAQ
jgi:hypothetical protein